MTRKPLISDPECLRLFDAGICGECFMLPRLPAIEEDEYSFIDWSLQRWHDRAYKHDA